MEIQVLGAHNVESKDTRCVSFLVDEVLALDAGGITSSLDFTAQQKLRAVLITHYHYDHIRDIPALAMNFFLNNANLSLYSSLPVREALAKYLLNDDVYPDFLERPRANPVIKFTVMEPLKTREIAGYSVLPAALAHAVPALGYQITSADGKAVFYTGDTGPGLADCWRQISPQLLVIEVTAPSRYEDFARKTGHLTPSLLKQELMGFREIRGYLPDVVTVHMNPLLETEIAAELAQLAKELNTQITPAREGQRVHL